MLEVINDTEQYTVDWPGWLLSENHFGDEFDEEARIRMIIGSKKLIPYLVKYGDLMGEHILEVGPFFNPLSPLLRKMSVISQNAEITFLENDPYAVKWLTENVDSRILDLDINDQKFTEMFAETLGDGYLGVKNMFTSVILSQVLNYVDYDSLFRCLFATLRPGSVVFINNVIDYGLPPLFSAKRPGSDIEIIVSATRTGFSVVEADLLGKSGEKEKSNRLITVLSKS